ncbi:cdc42 effector protein 1 [Synchiropus picturatus]
MNLQEKLSGLKGLVTHSQGKRRYKTDLTVDMISPPLGDFRHTMHVGRGGDVFGDTSFLSNHGGPANGNNGETDSISTPDSRLGSFFSRTLRQIRRSSDNRPREASKDLSPPPPAISPIIKNAISLPRLDVDLPNGSPTKVLFPSAQNSPEERKSSYGLDSGFVTLPRLSRSERQQPSISFPTSCSPNVHRGSLTDPSDVILPSYSTSVLTSEMKPSGTTAYSDSLPSLTSLDTFTFDLGPSLMSEVLGLLSCDSEEHAHSWEREEEGSATNDGSEMDSATISYVDSLLREECGSGKSPSGAEWDEHVDVSGAVTGSPERVRMESERFQIASDVLARHYAVGSLMKEKNKVEDSEKMMISPARKKTSYSYLDDDDEIKV